MTNKSPLREARINLEQFEQNLRLLEEKNSAQILDLRNWGYGHGILPLATVAYLLGISKVLINKSDITQINFEQAWAPIKAKLEFIIQEELDLGSNTLASNQLISAQEVLGLVPPEHELFGKLLPILRLQAKVINTKRVAAGHGVSYDYRFRTPQASFLTLVPLGYADGISRKAINRLSAVVGGISYPINSTVAMDQFVLATEDREYEVGEPVYLFGSGSAGELSTVQWAAAIEQDPLVVCSRIGRRVIRSYQSSGQLEQDFTQFGIATRKTQNG